MMTLTEIVNLPKGDTMETAREVCSELARLQLGDTPTREPYRAGPLYWPSDAPISRGPGTIVVDEVGVGAGVYDRLSELVEDRGKVYGWRVDGFNASSGVDDGVPHAARYLNLRAAAYWRLRTELEKGRISLPRHDLLWQELLAHRWTIHQSSGRIQVLSKDLVKSAIKRSPDRADAMSMAWSGGTRRQASVSFYATEI